jgi:hypothetical protein
MTAVVVSSGLSGRKHDAFDSAARAIMMDETPGGQRDRSGISFEPSRILCRAQLGRHGPVRALIRSKSHMPATSPFAATGMPYRVATSTMSLRRSMRARSVLRIVLVRAWTVRFWIPVWQIRSTRASVSGWSGRSRILHETGTERAPTRPVRIAQSLSGVERRPAPAPLCVENDLGQPQLRSTPATSCSIVSAAWTARSGSAVPIC